MKSQRGHGDFSFVYWIALVGLIVAFGGWAVAGYFIWRWAAFLWGIR